MRPALEGNFDATRRALGDRWLMLLAICLAGYAIMGKGFAYFGLPPVFIGEICLALGLFVALLTRGWERAFRVPAMLAVVPLCTWGIIRLIPGIAQYQIEAARDAVVWGYALFAVIVATLIVADPVRLPRLIGWYRKFIPMFLILILPAFLWCRFARESVPGWPWSPMAVLLVKEADVLVHLAGILAFWMADSTRTVRWSWAVLLTINMALMGVIDRAGVVAFGAVMVICMLAKPRHGAVWRTVSVLALGIVLMWGSNLKIDVQAGKGRQISFDQFWVNIQSIFGHSHNEGLDSNKEWRLNWWGDIIDYTVYGKYFWTGKGFGINLADDDGFQVNSDGSLRSPHNVHMTVLARMGVPGAALWLATLGSWFYAMAHGYWRARRRGDEQWCGLFLFLGTYFLAFAINGSFDVFIEGPMGGIWFWTIFGVGVGALWAYRNCPQVLTETGENAGARRPQLLPAAGWRRPGLPVGVGAARVARG
ncbi:MAG: O-antigen ligase family protein [Tepidisphaeraceae bacterium]